MGFLQISPPALGQFVNAKQFKKEFSSLFCSDIAKTDQVEAVPKYKGLQCGEANIRCSRNRRYSWERDTDTIFKKLQN